jgi:hypothetical protein
VCACGGSTCCIRASSISSFLRGGSSSRSTGAFIGFGASAIAGLVERDVLAAVAIVRAAL